MWIDCRCSSITRSILYRGAQVLTQAGAYVKDDACRALAIVIMNASQLHGYAVRSMYTALAANVAGAEAPLLMVSTWCIGEFHWNTYGGVQWMYAAPMPHNGHADAMILHYSLC